MLVDRVRMDAFVRALRGAVRPGSVVVDIGTGPGIMAVLACQLGASRVFAIELSPVIQVARDIAVANHCADKIEFFEDISTHVTLPVRADVVVSDLRGVLPLLGHHIPSIVDARKRFLASGGALIGRKDRIWAAIVDAPVSYSKIADVWERDGLGQDLGAARRKVLNEFHRARMTPEQLLTAPKLWATLDYTTIESPDVRGKLDWKIERKGIGHGMLVWFDAELADGIGFSNAPTEPETIYGSIFFPWLNPVTLAAGQSVCADIEAKLMEQDYFWRWTTKIGSLEAPGEILVHFDQSQLEGMLLSSAKLRMAASDYIPRLSEEGRMRQRALELMDGRASLEEIARRLITEFPERFNRWQAALSFAGALSKENSL